MISPTSVRAPPIILAESWRRYRTTGDREARNELILAYSPVVKHAAGRIAARMPAHVSVDELVSYGLDGLIDAVAGFDPARGIKFESYAGMRIRGAIFDKLRSLDWVPRSVRAEARQIENATADLSARLHRLPTDTELATKLSMAPSQLDASLQRVAGARMVALDEPWAFGETDEGSTRMEMLPDPDAVDPAGSADATDVRERIVDAIKHLPEREQLILGLRYHQGMRNSEIGEILGISAARVSELHTKAVIHARALITGASAEECTAFGPRRFPVCHGKRNQARR